MLHTIIRCISGSIPVGTSVFFLDDFIEIGLDVIHPIQKYTMDEQEIAERINGQICIWTGMDVQQILPRGTPEDVRNEVRFMIDTYDLPQGGCMITAGNGITPDVPLENFFAFYDEAYAYGITHRDRFTFSYRNRKVKRHKVDFEQDKYHRFNSGQCGSLNIYLFTLRPNTERDYECCTDYSSGP